MQHLQLAIHFHICIASLLLAFPELCWCRSVCVCVKGIGLVITNLFSLAPRKIWSKWIWLALHNFDKTAYSLSVLFLKTYLCMTFFILPKKKNSISYNWGHHQMGAIEHTFLKLLSFQCHTAVAGSWYYEKTPLLSLSLSEVYPWFLMAGTCFNFATFWAWAKNPCFLATNVGVVLHTTLFSSLKNVHVVRPFDMEMLKCYTQAI